MSPGALADCGDDRRRARRRRIEVDLIVAQRRRARRPAASGTSTTAPWQMISVGPVTCTMLSRQLLRRYSGLGGGRHLLLQLHHLLGAIGRRAAARRLARHRAHPGFGRRGDGRRRQRGGFPLRQRGSRGADGTDVDRPGCRLPGWRRWRSAAWRRPRGRRGRDQPGRRNAASPARGGDSPCCDARASSGPAAPSGPSRCRAGRARDPNTIRWRRSSPCRSSRDPPSNRGSRSACGTPDSRRPSPDRSRHGRPATCPSPGIQSMPPTAAGRRPCAPPERSWCRAPSIAAALWPTACANRRPSRSTSACISRSARRGSDSAARRPRDRERRGRSSGRPPWSSGRGPVSARPAAPNGRECQARARPAGRTAFPRSAGTCVVEPITLAATLTGMSSDPAIRPSPCPDRPAARPASRGSPSARGSS